MSIRSLVLFSSEGKGTPAFFGQLRGKAPSQPLQAQAYLVDGGIPSAYFQRWWSQAFPARQRLPDRIANKDGTGTDLFWDVFA